MQMKSLASLFLFSLGTAIALPTTPAIKVALSQSTTDPLSVVAVVTNDGPAPISVLKAGILYPHPLSVVQVIDPNGEPLAFEGLRAVFDIDGEGDQLWTTVDPGKAFTNTLKLDSSYQFSSAGEYTVSSSAYIQTKTSPAAEEILVPYFVTIKLNVSAEAQASQATTFAVHAKREPEGLTLEKRALAVVDPSCTGWKYDQARQALWDAFGLSYQAAVNVPKLGPVYNTFFKSASNSGFIAQKYRDMGSTAGAQTCTGNPGCVIRFTCNVGTRCNGGAVAVSSGDVIYACDPFWSYGASGNCANPSAGKPDILVHEISHSHQIGDIVYGLNAAKQLSADQAKQNADNYRFYARAIASGCNW